MNPNQVLTTREALQALLDGNKIRSNVWPKGEFIYMSGNLLFNNLRMRIIFDLDMDYDYEIYQD
jgi:hypothetical protein